MRKHLNDPKHLNFELFFDLTPDLLCIAGYDGYFRRVNPAVSKVLGYSLDELYSKPIHEFIYHEDKEITARHRSNLIRNNSLLNFENRYVTKSGEIVWLSWTSISVNSDQVVYAIAKNISHRKKLEEDKNQVISNLTKFNDDLKLLTYKTSHDLRSPVNNLLSLFSLMDVSKIQDEETLDFIEKLKSATENLKETLNDYVDHLNEKGSLNVMLEEVSFNDALNTVCLSLSSLIQSSRVKFHIDFSELERITFNRAYLESIFLNLITNSIKYALPDSLPEISIVSKNVNGVNQLIFSDKGQGFDMEKVKDRIFGFRQKFHNLEDSKGIGLYLVYNHITSLGGRIAIESKINEGATFTLSFKT
ncbi:MAG TPA: PAS domain-containing sensor histidine kinase [Sphingobacteriaceae bacterium]